MSKAGSAAKVKLSSYDDLFGNAEEKTGSEEQIIRAKLTDLHEFRNHPFRVLDDEKMEETTESISKYVVKGKFGAYCKQKCGMNVGRAMGATFSDTQMKSLLEGKKTLVRGLKGKKGSYDAYLIPEGIEDYSYIKDGKEIKGSQYKFKMEFPPRKSK